MRWSLSSVDLESLRKTELDIVFSVRDTSLNVEKRYLPTKEKIE